MAHTASTSAQHSDPLTDITLAQTTLTLANGLTVIVAENHDTPLVSVNMIYLVGSKDEVAGKTGFAHLFEHLMFEGSENAPGSFVATMTRAGASDINAFTGPDRTTYHFTVPVGSLDYGLFLESDRMGHFLSSINQYSLDQQRRVVLNEKLETESGPYGKIYETAVKGAFPTQHPYAHTVIGEAEDLQAATLDDVRQWFTRWYTPSNAILTLSGAITVEQAREKAERWFGHIPAGEPQVRASRWVPQISTQRCDRYQARVADTTMMFYWNIPPFGEPDSVRLSMIADLLTGSVSGQMIKALVYDEPVLSHVSLSLNPGVLCSQLILQATLNEGQDPSSVRRKILDQIALFIREGTDEQSLRQIRQDSLTFFSQSYRTSSQIAGLLSSSFAQWGRADGYLEIYRTYQHSEVADLQQTAKRWLTDAYYLLLIEPFPETASVQHASGARQAPAILAPESARLPDRQYARLDNGLPVQLAERHTHPDIFLDLLLPQHLASAPGLTNLLTGLLNMSGVHGQDTFAFDRRLRSAGVNLQLKQRLHHISLTLGCRKSQLSEGLTLLKQRLTESELSEQDVIRQQQQLSALSDGSAIASTQSLRVLPAVMYPLGHPCRVPQGVEMTRSALQSLNTEHLRAQIPEMLNLAGASLMVSGDITLAELLPLLNRTLGQLDHRDWHPHSVPLLARSSSPRLYIIDIPGAEQSSLIAASLVPGNNCVDEASFDLLNDLFANGFTSRLNLNLREDKNWTYGVKCGLINDPLNRVHYVQTEIQTDKTVEAFQELLTEYRGISGLRPVGEQELEQLRTTSLLATAGWGEGLEDLNNMFTYLQRNQLPTDFWQQYQQQLRTVTLDEINRLAAEIFSEDSLTWIIAGDSAVFTDALTRHFHGQMITLAEGGESLYDPS